MINIEDNGLFEIFPAIKTISETFEYQNSMLNKIVLTGKINALEIAENLFNFTEQTAQTFTELQSEIVLNLLRENQNELFSKAKTKSQISIDLLIKNIYLRKLDIEILSKDSYINKFLNNEIDKTEMAQRLKSFSDKYTIYNEIMLLDKEGNVKVNINEENRVRKSKDSMLEEAKKTDEILMTYKKTDLFVKQRESFFYIKKLDKGFLVLFLNFKDETNRIFESLVTDNEIITIVDKHSNIIVSSEKGVDKSLLKGVKKTDSFVVFNNMFHVKTKSEIDTDLDWYAVTTYKRRKDINIMAEFSEEENSNRHLAQIHLNNKELQKLADDGYAILEDLSDVIINGELIAAKSKQYILIPILDNLREVSFRIVKLIELSIRSLQSIIDESLTNDVTIISKFINDSLMRSLYEKCNDVKWWSVYLQDKLEDQDLSNTLSQINELYPSYKDIFVYNSNSEIIAISNSSSLIGTKVPHNYTLSNKDENKCFVSNFETNVLSDEKVYVYYATIFKDGVAIGGVGAVYDVQ